MLFGKRFQVFNLTLLMFGLAFALAAPGSIFAQEPPPQERPRRVMPTEETPQDVMQD